MLLPFSEKFIKVLGVSEQLAQTFFEVSRMVLQPCDLLVPLTEKCD